MEYLEEQRDEGARDERLRRASRAEEDDVLAGEDGVLDLRDHGLVVPDDPGEQRRLAGESGHEVRAKLLLHGPAAVAALAERADRRWTVWAHGRSPSFIGRSSTFTCSMPKTRSRARSAMRSARRPMARSAPARSQP